MHYCCLCTLMRRRDAEVMHLFLWFWKSSLFSFLVYSNLIKRCEIWERKKVHRAFSLRLHLCRISFRYWIAFRKSTNKEKKKQTHNNVLTFFNGENSMLSAILCCRHIKNCFMVNFALIDSVDWFSVDYIKPLNIRS